MNVTERRARSFTKSTLRQHSSCAIRHLRDFIALCFSEPLNNLEEKQIPPSVAFSKVVKNSIHAPQQFPASFLSNPTSACDPFPFPLGVCFLGGFLRQNRSLCAPNRSAKSSFKYVVKPAGVLETVDNATQKSGVHEDDGEHMKKKNSRLQPPAFLHLLCKRL